MSVDDSQLEALARDLGKVPAKMVPKLRGVVKKGALNMKKTMQRDARASKHFKQIAPTIDYTETSANVFGSQFYRAEIGPNKDRGGSASLAGIAYFGSSRPGGGTIRDPIEALAEEEPNFIKYIEDATEGLL